VDRIGATRDGHADASDSPTRIAPKRLCANGFSAS
jgi:hypothetical protein